MDFNANHLINYGCWCQMDPASGLYSQRKGRALDGLDQQCRNWHRCYKCIRKDSAESCDPDNVEYIANYIPEENKFFCDAFENSSCENQACLCDVEVATQMFNGFTALDNSYVNVNGFDHAASCVPMTNSGKRDLDCCGTFPYRWTFNTDARECCSGVISALGTCSDYDPDMTVEPPTDPPTDAPTTTTTSTTTTTTTTTTETDACEGVTCSNYGTCYVDAYAQPYCICDEGWMGDNCATEVSSYFGAKTRCAENEGRRDLAILVDVSGKTNRKTDVFEFVKKISQSVDLDKVKVSLTTYAVLDEEHIFPAQFSSLAEIETNVESIKWGGDKTRTMLGLNTAARSLDKEDSIADMILVISDGWESGNIEGALNAASDAASAGITLVAAAVATSSTRTKTQNLLEPELDFLAALTQNVDGNVFALRPDGLDAAAASFMDLFNALQNCEISNNEAKEAAELYLATKVVIPTKEAFNLQSTGSMIDFFGYLPDWAQKF